MSAVDFPPGIGLPADARARLCAPPARRRYTRVLLFMAGLLAVWVVRKSLRIPPTWGTTSGLVMAALAMNLLAFAVRRATMEFHGDAVAWGWSLLRFRLALRTITGVNHYPEALTLRTKYGSVWYLSARDWGDVAPLAAALARSGVEVTKRSGRPTLREHLAGYGIPLDIAQAVAVAALLVYGAWFVRWS